MKLARLAVVVMALLAQAGTTAVSKSVAENQRPRALPVDTRGKLLIIVRDSLTGAPVPYANVRLAGTRLGALTDESGRGMIIGIPPGVVEVRVVVPPYEWSRDSVVVKANRQDTLRVLLRKSGGGAPLDLDMVQSLRVFLGLQAKADSVAGAVAKPGQNLADSATASPRNPKQHN